MRSNLVAFSNHAPHIGFTTIVLDTTPILAIDKESSNDTIGCKSIKDRGSVDIWTVVEGKSDRARSSASADDATSRNGRTDVCSCDAGFP